MKTITLNKDQIKLLSELLSLDLDNIGFNDDEIEILNEVYRKVNEN